MLVSAAQELRSSWTTSESRCVEWSGLFITEANLDSQRNDIPVAISSSRTISEAAEKLGGKSSEAPSFRFRMVFHVLPRQYSDKVIRNSRPN